MHCAEKLKELASDESITDPNVRQEIEGVKSEEGVGIVEAARGTLIHHYKVDEKGIVTDANLIVATTHNKIPVNIAIRKAAAHFIKNGKVDEGILNLVEIAYRPYDLCLACASHTLFGKIPVEIEIYSHEGELVKTLRNFDKK